MSNTEILAELQTILDTHNPCDIKVIDSKATCRDGDPCCSGCPLLTSKGCSTVSPACKFYFCPTAWASLTETVQNKIIALGKEYKGLLYQRMSKDITPLVNPPFQWRRTGDHMPRKHDPFFNGYLYDINKREYVLKA